MSTFSVLREGLRIAGLVAVTAAVALPAVAGEVYSWRTEDGGYAFTDDEKAVPARYRSQVTTRSINGLGGYDRLTAPPAGAGDAYSQRLANRLDWLRELNRDLDAAFARPEPQTGLASLSIQAGSLNLGLPIDRATEEPVVVEKVRFRHENEMATRHNLVVKQGGRILTIIKGDPLVGPINQAPDIGEMARE